MAARRPAKPKPDPLVREQDGHLVALVALVIEGPDVRFYVRAGEVVPIALADFPRRRRP
jgi:hypothetical protein